MTPTFENRYLLLVAAGLATVGTVDAGLSREWDLLAVFAGLDVILAILGLRSRGRRVMVPLRSDLVAWLRHRAATHGEPLESVADRAVATYRARLDPAERTPG